MSTKQEIFLRLDRVIPYFTVLYFAEIMYLMVAFAFMFGKVLAVPIAGALSVLLAVHVFMLYLKKPLHRVVQLALMDMHCAYSIPFAYSLVFHGSEFTGMDTVFMTLRLSMAAAELAFIFALTDDNVKRSYA
ncbi:MAG: hypothetical protein EPN93_04090 [Spirochaetes bacterium]|nr:MAG: hypothetical protein EPN93_04090 [Spirochaetota bacterium]